MRYHGALMLWIGSQAERHAAKDREWRAMREEEKRAAIKAVATRHRACSDSFRQP